MKGGQNFFQSFDQPQALGGDDLNAEQKRQVQGMDKGTWIAFDGDKLITSSMTSSQCLNDVMAYYRDLGIKPEKINIIHWQMPKQVHEITGFEVVKVYANEDKGANTLLPSLGGDNLNAEQKRKVQDKDIVKGTWIAFIGDEFVASGATESECLQNLRINSKGKPEKIALIHWQMPTPPPVEISEFEVGSEREENGLPTSYAFCG